MNLAILATKVRAVIAAGGHAHERYRSIAAGAHARRWNRLKVCKVHLRVIFCTCDRCHDGARSEILITFIRLVESLHGLVRK